MKKNRKSIIEVSIIVAIIAIFAKIIGFGREAIIAAYYGANNQTDAYFLARNMPALIFPAVCNSLSTAFLSVYVTTKVKEGLERADLFVSRSINISLLISLVLSFIAFIMSPLYVPLLAPGFDTETTKLAVKLTRITMAGFSLTMIQYMLTAVLNSKKFFFGAQIAGIFNNIFIITITILFGKNYGVVFLTLVVIGGLLVQAITLIYLSNKWVKYSFELKIKDSLINKMIHLTIPILLGNSVIQLSTIVDKIIASNLGEGAVSSLSYTNSLNSVVISVFIVSVSTVLYPTLTENASENDDLMFTKNLIQNLMILVLVIAPISMITVIYSEDIIKLVYYRGEFNVTAVQFTTNALTYYSLGYVFIAIREVIIRGFYATGNSKIPMKNGIISVAINIILSIILSKFIGIRGIALGTSISALISAITLLIIFKNKIKFIKYKQTIPTVIKTVIAIFFTSFILVFISNVTHEFHEIIRFTIAIIIGFGFYTFILFLLRCKELIITHKMLTSWIKKKFYG